MFPAIATWRNRCAGRMIAFCLAATALLLASANVSAQANCQNVHGHFQSQLTNPVTCTSPVGLCTVGSFTGGLRGDFTFVTTNLTPTSATGVSLYTGNTSFHGRVEGKMGDLMIQNAGLLHAAGNLAEFEVISGGSGELTGASGLININGAFNLAAGIGQGDYAGMICIP